MSTRTSLLTLPLEMRLEIYSHASLLSLLILTHTCRTMYTDINCSLLVRRSKGCPRNPVSNNHPILPDNVIPLTIPTMANKDEMQVEECVNDDYTIDDFDLFNRLYQYPSPFRNTIAKENKMVWLCCKRCRLIKRREEYVRRPILQYYRSGRTMIRLTCGACYTGRRQRMGAYQDENADNEGELLNIIVPAAWEETEIDGL
ncbi:hypothetical protein BJ508DRAFT_333545 [Ascobolus immersus RN42]|uniref:F-box domain-containing protein n=1 Tax=Ascobolus immersus RN42 TaxID=1160509 RepID=A0A3N4HNA0_ASCIM|nr:hypothetical protein BJ508DRAFT_333545 [Ascobolus immersus RN42]